MTQICMCALKQHFFANQQLRTRRMVSGHFWAFSKPANPCHSVSTILCYLMLFLFDDFAVEVDAGLCDGVDVDCVT